MASAAEQFRLQMCLWQRRTVAAHINQFNRDMTYKHLCVSLSFSNLSRKKAWKCANDRYSLAWLENPNASEQTACLFCAKRILRLNIDWKERGAKKRNWRLLFLFVNVAVFTQSHLLGFQNCYFVLFHKKEHSREKKPKDWLRQLKKIYKL